MRLRWKLEIRRPGGGPTSTGRVFSTGLLLLLPVLPAACAQAPPTTDPQSAPRITYTGDQLTINALNLSLSEILTKVAALTGAKLDVPPAAAAEKLPVVQLGPGPARQVLSSLLGDTSFDYVIQASDSSPDRIASVVLLVREKKGAPAAPTEARSMYSRRSRNEEAVETAAPAQPEPAPVAVSSNNSPASSQPDAPPARAVDPLHSNDSIASRPGAMSPPATLDAHSMGQQLQQMYQQRAQMVQQEKQTNVGAAPSTPLNK